LIFQHPNTYLKFYTVLPTTAMTYLCNLARY